MPLRVLQAATLPRLIRLAWTLSAVSSFMMPKHHQPRSTLRFPCGCLPRILTKQGNPLAGLNSPSEFDPCTTSSSRAQPKLGTATRVLPRFGSLWRFSNCAERLTPATPTSSGYAAPLGFFALSMPCSPRGLSDLFHSDSTFGIRPSRFSTSQCVVRPSGRPDPLHFCRDTNATPVAPGLCPH